MDIVYIIIYYIHTKHESNPDCGNDKYQYPTR